MRLCRAVALLVVAMTTVAARAEEFISSDLLPSYDPSVQAVTYMGRLVREKTGGQHSIQVRSNSSIGTDNLAAQQVRNGAIAMARVRLATFHNIVPETVPMSLPFVFRSANHLRGVIDGPIGDEILAALASAGFIGLCFYDTGPRSLYSAKAHFRTANDLKGVKIRIQSSDALATVLQTLGAFPQPVPLTRVRDSLRSGAVDAAEFDLQSYEGLRHFEVAPLYSLTEHRFEPSVLVFSKVIWERLSKEHQEAIRASAKASVPFMRARWEESEARARKSLEVAGVKILAGIDRASFKDAMLRANAKLLGIQPLEGIFDRIQAETREGIR